MDEFGEVDCADWGDYQRYSEIVQHHKVGYQQRNNDDKTRGSHVFCVIIKDANDYCNVEEDTAGKKSPKANKIDDCHDLAVGFLDQI